MSGTPTQRGADRELAWASPLQRLEQSGNHVDPYTLWSIQTAFRQHLRRGSPLPQVIDFLVELDEPMAPEGGRLADGVEVPMGYRQALPGGSLTSRHITARLRVPGTVEALQAAVMAFVCLPAVKRAQIGFPMPALADGNADGSADGHADGSPEPVGAAVHDTLAADDGHTAPPVPNDHASDWRQCAWDALLPPRSAAASHSRQAAYCT